MFFWLFVLFGATAAEVTNENYYTFPLLFHLDDYEQCLSRRGGAYCVGTFELVPDHNSGLLDLLEEYTQVRSHFNRSLIHRGVCLTTSCANSEPNLTSRFEECVDNGTRSAYGLGAQLSQLEYCKTEHSRREVDEVDVVFAFAVCVLIACNVLGTLYDMFKSKDVITNKIFMAWSVKANWSRLTADYSGGDPKLAALNPIQGVKALTLILVMQAHSVLAYHLGYMYNPQFMEIGSTHPLSINFQNGSVIVMTFVMLSSFLLAYNLLLHVEGSKKQLTLRMLPQCLFHRLARLVPLSIFVVGLTATWWAHMSHSPLWTPLVEREAQVCRSKWWAQMLFINNFYKPDDKCLIQTWFLAVDMQLYVVAVFLTLTMGRWPRKALKVLGCMFVASVILNFCVCYYFGLEAIVALMYPELMRTQYIGNASFNWLYMSPWGSLPASLLGLFVAFLLHELQKSGYNLEKSKCMRILYRMSVPAMFLWVWCGFWMKNPEDPVVSAGYATLDRPVFTLIVAVALLGFFSKIDNLWWRFLSWRGWQILGRLSLPVLLIHWNWSLLLVALRAQPALVSLFEISGVWLVTILMTYLSALPLHLFIELPAQRFLQALFM